MRFYGNEICCGSYACLNAMQDPSIDLQLFEISTSTPFGIRHFENEHFDRLLTTYCDPNQGMDRALRLWGYDAETVRTGAAKEAVREIRRRISPEYPVIVGPIDMGKLGYQIMPALLKRMDHYILLEYCSDTEAYCTDSEGFYQYRLTYEELGACLSADAVPEADGCITVRQIRKNVNTGWKKSWNSRSDTRRIISARQKKPERAPGQSRTAADTWSSIRNINGGFRSCTISSI